MVPVFVQPFPLFFACFELHVIFFLGGHPTHEAVEVMLARRSSAPPLVWAIVTHHDQSQADYVSDPEVVRALKETRSGTRPVHHAEFELRDTARGAGSFATAFTDASGEGIELYFDPASEPSSDHAGLIDPGGHSRQSSFPFMWSDRAGIGSPESHVRIKGEPYKIPVEVWVPFFFTGVRAFRAEGFCLGAIAAGEFESSVEKVPTAVETGASWRYRTKGGTRVFKLFKREGDRLLVSESDRVSRALGTEIFARVQATEGRYRLDGLEARSAFAPDSVLELDFEPTLPDLGAGVDTPFEGRFRVSLAGRSEFVSGRVRVAPGERDAAIVQLLPEEPAWAVSRRVTLALSGDTRKLGVRVSIGQ